MPYAYEARELSDTLKEAEEGITELLKKHSSSDLAHALRQVRTARLFVGEVIKEIEQEADWLDA